MFVKQFLIGGDRNFAYLAADEKSGAAFVVDPSYNPKTIVDFATENNYEIKYIFNTHRHHDHTNGNKEIEKLTGITPLAFGDTDPASSQKIADSAKLPLGESEIKIIHTPGHTEDDICLLAGDALFSGDTLFVGKVGGTGFGADARAEYESLHNKLLKLPDETRVFPGHNYGTAPQSTIKKERETNPFLLQPDFDSFLHLKKNWAEYKKKHGID